MAMSDRMKSIADMTSSMTTRSPERTLDKPTVEGVIKNFMSNLTPAREVTPLSDKERMELNKFRQSLGASDKDIGMRTRSPDGSITAREVQVAGEFEDMLMKNYESAVEQGYKGTFFDFLIDQMDEEFDPSSPMRVSKLPEGIMQIMKMMQDRKKV
jgi:hypothetical protein